MQAALRIETTVLPGNRVEICTSQLPEGAKIVVAVVLAVQSAPPKNFDDRLRQNVAAAPFGIQDARRDRRVFANGTKRMGSHPKAVK